MMMTIFGFAEPFSSWTHLAAAGLSLAGGVFLLRRGQGNLWRVSALAVYVFSMIFLFSMSGVYHLLEQGGDARAVLKRLDHAAIWTLIAGTFTPIHAILFRGPWRWLVLGLVWLMAITGLTLELVFFDNFPEWLLLTLFLGFGWIGLMTALHFRAVFRHPSLKLLVLGGVAYSLGAITDFLQWPVLIDGVVGGHEIFHVFVMLGALFHWLFIYEWADYPVSDEITFKVLMFPGNTYVAVAENENIGFQAASKENIQAQIAAGVAKAFRHVVRPRIKMVFSTAEYLPDPQPGASPHRQGVAPKAP